MSRLKELLSTTTLILGLGSIISYSHVATAELSNNTFQQQIAERAIQEWIDFNAPNRPVVQSHADVHELEKKPLEYSKCQTINQYWSVVPATDTKPPKGDTCLLPQRAKPESAWDTYPWSAAFISYIMHESGAGNQFIYSGRHAIYIVDSVRNRDTPNYPFRGYSISEKKPEIGDLICAPREESKNLTYSEISQQGDFKSHCDIVVAKNGNNNIEVIGGNVGDTVAKTIVLLDSSGRIKVTDANFRPWFVIIKNQSSTVNH